MRFSNSTTIHYIYIYVHVATVQKTRVLRKLLIQKNIDNRNSIDQKFSNTLKK